MICVDRAQESARVVAALIAAGWVVTDETRRAAVYLHWPNEPDRSMVVPNNPNAAEYDRLMDVVMDDLGATAKRGDDARRALNALTEAGVIL